MTPETSKLLGITETKDKNDENVPHLEITEVIFVQCNVVKYNYQQNSVVLYTFVPNKSFSQLLEIQMVTQLVPYLLIFISKKIRQVLFYY